MSVLNSLLTEKSFVLDYWKFVLSISVAAICWMIVKNLRKNPESASEENETKNSVVKNPVPLDGEEYIGEYQADPSYDELTPFLESKEHVPFHGAKVTLDGGAVKFYSIANDRRSVRMYSKRPVDYEIIKKCIHAAGTGPSGAHTEPWTFCVIQDAAIKVQIREIIEAEEYLNYKQRMARQWTVDLSPLKTTYLKEYLTDAPYLILVFKKTYSFRADGKKQQNYYHEISTAISTGILLSALQCAGLSSLITTPLNCGPALRLLLQRPANEKLLVLLPVGYPADDCRVPDLQRKPLDEILVKY